LNSTSSPAKRATVSSTTRLHSAALATSARTNRPRPAGISPTVRWPAASLTSATVTLAPSRANASAVARPIPSAPPVTMTTLPSKSAIALCPDEPPRLDLAVDERRGLAVAERLLHLVDRLLAVVDRRADRGAGQVRREQHVVERAERAVRRQ